MGRAQVFSSTKFKARLISEHHEQFDHFFLFCVELTHSHMSLKPAEGIPEFCSRVLTEHFFINFRHLMMTCRSVFRNSPSRV